jgi:hypothetical protein
MVRQALSSKGTPTPPTPPAHKGGLARPELEPLDLQQKNIQRHSLGKNTRDIDQLRKPS